MAVHDLPASELLDGPRRGGDEDKGPRLACILQSGHALGEQTRADSPREMIMTRNKAQKAVTRQRMAETGEPYTVARRATLSSDDPSSEEQYAREAREAGVSEAEIAAQLAAFRLRDAAEQARELADAAEEAADVAERRAELARDSAGLAADGADRQELARALEHAEAAERAAERERARADAAEDAADAAEERAELAELAEEEADLGRRGPAGRRPGGLPPIGALPPLPPQPPQPPRPPRPW
ncbi:MAG TPA: hypothetical protein VN969_07315 [Streptosporangiaceae bacterium]|nr:hypothetical protein [Streptosporangiaceae bacterium]